MYDYFTQTNKNLDSIYVRQFGLTLNANQIYGGTFNKAEFYFNSNIFWDYDNDSELNYNNIKLHLCNNIYDNIKLFYTNNYYDYYIENIDLINYI